MFIYENGLPVGYDHTVSMSECKVTCQRPEEHAIVEQHMLDWYRSLPGQMRVRTGKRDRMLYGSEVNLKRLENE